MFIEINRIIKLSHCFKYWSGNAPGRSARSRPLAAARGAIPPRTRTIGISWNFQLITVSLVGSSEGRGVGLVN